jgi:hypothetical protein
MRGSVQKNLRLTPFQFPLSAFRFSKPLFKNGCPPADLATDEHGFQLFLSLNLNFQPSTKLLPLPDFRRTLTVGKLIVVAMREIKAEIKHGDCLNVLADYPDSTFDLEHIRK